MASSINAANPVSGNPTTASVRANFSAAKSEIETLQTDVAAKANTASPTFTGTATFADITLSDTTPVINIFDTDAAGPASLSSNDSGDLILSTTGLSSALVITGAEGRVDISGALITTLNATNFEIGGVSISATAAELNYCDGVTSNIQTQLDGKASKAGDTFTGDVAVDTGAAIAYVRVVSSNTGSSRIQFGDSDSGAIGELVYRHSDDSLAFETNNVEAFRIDSSQRLVFANIPTTNPGGSGRVWSEGGTLKIT